MTTGRRGAVRGAPGTAPGPAVVALGGGHGLHANLSALRLLAGDLTAVVTVADDGGSSGRLREEMAVLPPGDLRMALSALCDDSEWGHTWRDVLQHRFTSDGPLDGHAVGNLLIVALWELLDDPVAGLDWVGRLLGARGRVLPMAAVPLGIEADLELDGVVTTVRGQSRVAVAGGRVRRVRLLPADPPADETAVRAVLGADWVVLGPGSWFTSVMPHLLVPGLSAALHTTTARRCVTLNLATIPEQPGGMSAFEHLVALRDHAPDLRVDVVVADPTAVADVGAMAEVAAGMGAHLMLRQVRVGDGRAVHDPLRLAAAYQDAFEGVLGDLPSGSGLAG